MKALTSYLLAGLLFLVSVLPGHAEQTVKKSLANQPVYFYLQDTSGAAQTGKASNVVVKYSLGNSVTQSTGGGTVLEWGSGYYYYILPTSEIGTAGAMFYDFQCAGCQDYPTSLFVTANRTDDIAALIGTPAGASLAADIAANLSALSALPNGAAIATAVWGATTRTLSTLAGLSLNPGYFYAPVLDSGGTQSSSLTVTVTRNGSNQPVLSWSADTSATSYKVLRSSNGLTYTTITQTMLTSFTDTSRPAGNVYYSIISVH